MKRIEMFFKYFCIVTALILLTIGIINYSKIYNQLTASNFTETPEVTSEAIKNQSVKQKVLLVFFKPDTDIEKKIKPQIQEHISKIILENRPRIIYLNVDQSNVKKIMKNYDVETVDSVYLLPVKDNKKIVKINNESINELNRKLSIDNLNNEKLVNEFMNGNWES